MYLGTILVISNTHSFSSQEMLSSEQLSSSRNSMLSCSSSFLIVPISSTIGSIQSMPEKYSISRRYTVFSQQIVCESIWCALWWVKKLDTGAYSVLWILIQRGIFEGLQALTLTDRPALPGTLGIAQLMRIGVRACEDLLLVRPVWTMLLSLAGLEAASHQCAKPYFRKLSPTLVFPSNDNETYYAHEVAQGGSILSTSQRVLSCSLGSIQYCLGYERLLIDQ